MKRKVLLALAFITWTLLCCTVFSAKIEELMTAKVVTAEDPPFGRTYLPLKTVFFDEMGWHLYYTYEGSGWESGTRVGELESGSYTVYDDPEVVDEITGGRVPPHVEAAAPWEGKLIQFSSRPLRAGEPAEILDKREHGDDTWLVLSALPLPEAPALPSGLELAAGNDTSLLLAVPEGPKPFLEPEARARLANAEELAERITPLTRDDLRIYSLEDLEDFSSSIPRVAAILALALAPAFLLPPMLLTRSPRYRRRFIAINGLLIAFTALAIWRLTDGTALPASLLPPRTIFDFRHYAGRIGQAVQALHAFNDNRAAYSALSAYNFARRTGLAILLAGVSLPITVFAAEAFINHRFKRLQDRGAAQFT